MSTLAERVNRRMTDLGLSQAEVARRSKVKPPSVAQWRNGHTKNLAGDVLLRAAQALQCRAVWLATGVGPIEDTPYQAHVLTAEEPQTTAKIVKAADKRHHRWPFAHIDLSKLSALSAEDAQQLEGAWRLTAKQMDFDIEVEAPARGKRRST